MTTTIKPQPLWVRRLRASLPRGWSINESANSIRLQVRQNGKGTSITLPLPWAPESLQPALEMLRAHGAGDTAGRDLKDAVYRVRAAAVPCPVVIGMDWAALVEAFRHDLMTHGNRIAETTWSERLSGRILDAAAAAAWAGAPHPSMPLSWSGRWSERWAEKPRSRALAVQAVGRFLAFAVADHGLPAASWTLSERDARRFRGALQNAAPRRR